jgi:hypothetical protein
MSWAKPVVSQVWRAIDVWIASAYGGKPPTAIRDRVETLRNMPPAEFYDSTSLERDDAKTPSRYSLRLGSRMYPHMKLVIERSPDGKDHLFRADTHDRHIRPAPDSREYKAFSELMAANQKLAEQIEAQWETAGLRTFKQYLRDDLARRTGGAVVRAGEAAAPPSPAAEPPAAGSAP